MAVPTSDPRSVHVPAWKLILKTCLTLWLVELGIMVALPVLNELPQAWMIALADGALVTLVACPVAYLWVFGTQAFRSRFRGAGTARAFLKFGVVVLLVEIAIMTALPLVSFALSDWGVALLDATLLAGLSAAFIPLAVETPDARSHWSGALPRLALKGLDLAPTLAVKITGVATLCTLLAVGATVRMSFNSASELLIEGAVDSLDTAALRQVERLMEATERVRADAAHMGSENAVAELLLARPSHEQGPQPTAIWMERLEQSFTSLLQAKGYWQVRLIDLRSGGMEVARADLDPETGAVRVLPAAELQDKSASDYVQSGRLLEPGQVLASRISLNREHGVVSLPETPTQRFVAPIFLELGREDSGPSLAGLVIQIRHLDELLTMAAIAAAQSGDLSWKTRYDENAVRLDESLAQFMATGDALQRQAARRISQENSVLLEMEESAFSLVSRGRSTEASRLLDSEHYRALKAGYAADLERLVEALDESSDVESREPDALLVINTFATPILHTSLDAGSDYRVLLVNEHGGYLHHEDTAHEWRFEDHGENQFKRQHPQVWGRLLESGSGRTSGDLGGDFFATNRVALNPGIDESYVTVLLLASRAELLAGVTELKTNLIALSVSSILMAGLLCMLTLRRLTRPIQDLTMGANLIAQGVQGVQLPTAGHDEVGQLGRALADLIAKLQERTRIADRKSAEVKELNESLEDQVMKRTARLLASEARLSTIMNSAGDAFITTDESGFIQFWNSAAAAMFGHARAKAVGMNIMQLIPGELRDPHKTSLRDFMNARKSDGVGKPVTVEARRSDGTSFPAKMTLTTAPTDGGILVVAILHDLSEERALQMELDQARKLESIGSLAAGVAHEINTPTQYVTDNVQFLEESCGSLIELAQKVLICMETQQGSENQVFAELQQELEDADLEFLVEEVPSAFQQSLQGLGSIAKIVRAMKEFSHPGSKDKAPADLAHIIENTATVGRNEWKYCAELELDLDPALPLVPCVTGDLGQVLLNLIVNAAHAIDRRREEQGHTDKGTITIRATLDDPWVELRVEDTGCGMTTEVSERIFDPFFTTKEVGKGTGQGLAIARTIIVERHGGTLTVESEVGLGTAFIIRLPLDLADVPAED